jgi:EpsD family peptidyl-prolyl cis-trans isomerase
MGVSRAALVPCLALLLLGGCDRLGLGGSADKGPVAVTVDGEKITVAQLDAELKAAEVQDAQNPEVRRAALQRIVLRKLLAKEARARKLDESPDMAHLKEAAVENLEAGLVQRDTLKAVAEPTDAEVQAFMAANPQMFAGRTVYLVDRLILPAQPDAATAAALEPANTFEAVMKVLDERKVPYRRTREQIDSLRTIPNIAQQIAKLPPRMPFVLPTPPGVSVNVVLASQQQPVMGQNALALARQALTNQRRQKAVADRVEGVTKAAEAKIVYAPEYAPPKPAAAK